ncbi:MAG: PSD1 and planctomycete cytochrome C domain-containing protein [Verrucomicrobiales bacterium]|nr:PSD1 and planctomycete cytochrome C domain-containing protein [Verrucomicrobiales bacterium]
MTLTGKFNRAAYWFSAVFLALCPGGFAREISFNRDIRPILSDRCFACHGPDASERKAKLRLDRADGPQGAYRVKDGHAAIVPGSVAESNLWERITTEDADDIMPPAKAHKKPLSSEEQQLIRKWIEGGANYEAFWSFVPAKKPPVPKVKKADWSSHPVDLHVLKRMEEEGLLPAEEADKRSLIRRLTFDLTGLPPARKDVRAFVSDENPKAYEQLVERLLASEGYGEHMARYWLDLVRFADTNGMHKDFFRNHAPYRDWVIRAFNENLGYDDFVRYQLAGDLFPEASNDQLVASGFNRLHLIIDRGTALPEESFFKNVVDRVTAVGTAFMGMTVHCASCHDHKYDPLTQKDFYSLFAFFNNIDAAAETAGAPKNGLQPPFMTLGTAQQKERLKQIDDQMAKMSPEVDKAKKQATDETEPAKKQDLTQEARALVAELQDLKREREHINRDMPRAMVMKERQEVRATHIMKRGQYDDPGDVVQRDAPGFLAPLKKSGEVATRMDLAEWFVSPENPLTARVAVNRFWQQFFGVGLVKTSEDLGAQGEMPSHPGLLDYLTVTFIESGWDIKALVRQIVLSKTYRQASVADPERFTKDPENRLLARGSRFRMDAEMIRDQILFTSGLLAQQMYGRSVKPPQPDGLWKAVTMIGERFRPDSGDAIYRRSLYTYWKRGMPPPQMTILNAPIRDACTARRERTNTPSQALLLLNENEYLKAARQLAMIALGPQDANTVQRVAFIYETITSKLPDPAEQRVLATLVENLNEKYAANPELADQICSGMKVQEAGKKAQLAAWTVLVNTLYNLDITKTRE